jgi:spatacsin
MILNQSLRSDISLLWESELDYHVCRNHWKEVFRLLDLMPAYALSAGSLQLNLDVVQSSSGCDVKSSNYGNFLCSIEELDSVCMEVPDVQIYKFSPDIFSGWIRMLAEEKLAKRFIFLREYWEGTMELVALLARSGYISGKNNVRLEDDLNETSLLRDGTVQALHKIFVHHCAQYNMPNLLDLYLDHHRLVLDIDSLYALQESAVSFVSIVCYFFVC